MGEYMCVIDENQTTCCNLYVEEPIFIFVKRLKSQSICYENKTTELECEVENENAECEWFYNGKVLKVSILKFKQIQ